MFLADNWAVLDPWPASDVFVSRWPMMYPRLSTWLPLCVRQLWRTCTNWSHGALFPCVDALQRDILAWLVRCPC